ncbi:MAG: Uma2 family endonuclease [Sumerlaeia bacterium]
MSTLTKTALFSLSDYYLMIDAGILENRKVELIKGEIVEMSPSGNLHYLTIGRIAALFIPLTAKHGLIGYQQSGLAIPELDSEPEPDFYLISQTILDGEVKAEPEQAFLVVEVADSSLRKDRMVKLPLYARAGIAEFWIVNLAEDCIEVYRVPDRAAGAYGDQKSYRRGDRFALLAFPDFEVAADAVLPRSPQA